MEEWEDVSSGWNSLMDAFYSPLRIPASGFRSCSDGSIKQQGKISYIWTGSSVKDKSRSIGIGADEPFFEQNNRAMGMAVRYVKAEK